MTFTYDDFLTFARSLNPEAAALFAKYRALQEPKLAPMLPKLGAKLREKGLWPPGGASGDDDGFSAEERAALVYLRQLNEALKTGGSEAGMQLWRDLVARPESRNALAAVAA